MLFSAKKVLANHMNYDLVIWVTTQPGRITLEYTNANHHFQISRSVDAFSEIEIKKKFEVFQLWYCELMDWHDIKFMDRCLVEHLQIFCDNLLIIPAFYDPMDSFFNLHQVSTNECISMFADKILPDSFYSHYQDTRIGHLSLRSQEILADKVVENLVPGCFQTSYDCFPQFDNPDFLTKTKF
jgi:hypothetical protein